MIFDILPAGMLQANCYILGDEKTRDGIVVDPGGDAEKILEICGNYGINVKYILLTHAHGDHIGGVKDIKERTGAEIIMNEKDSSLLEKSALDIIPYFRNIQLFKADRYVKEGDCLDVGDIHLSIIETPGHTPGSISILADSFVITGDTLFKGSIGRTDFPGGSFEQIMTSIRDKLSKLPVELTVYPGHGPESTIGWEVKYNPYLK